MQSQKLHKLLIKDRLFRKILDYVGSEGWLDLEIDSVEKYNQDGTTEGDGPFCTEGHKSVDINASYHIKPFSNPSDAKALAEATWSWLADSWEFKSWRFFTKTCPVKFTWTQWIFTVDSFDSFRRDVASTHSDARMLRFNGNYKAFNALVSEIAEGLGENEIHHYLLKNNHIALGSGMYANLSDPTCFVMNERFQGFDLKDGWSHNKITSIVMLYLAKAGYLVNVRRGGGHAFFKDVMATTRFIELEKRK